MEGVCLKNIIYSRHDAYAELHDYLYEPHEQSLFEKERKGGSRPFNLIPFTLFASYTMLGQTPSLFAIGSSVYFYSIITQISSLSLPFFSDRPLEGNLLCSGHEALFCYGFKDHVLRRIMSILFRGPQISVILASLTYGLLRYHLIVCLCLRVWLSWYSNSYWMLVVRHLAVIICSSFFFSL